ncbi:MAG: hypothetical protein A3B99_03455 [Candidatus Yanofskybacteria bacterium RIFCSPHIGHO2_02_FULL_44_12b]|uniref:Transmembrane protein n=2 Tax=Candidatus Yanofskyibacteriota TaxID=1752733 RepID=A0A1F8GME8_9BACT|nr:MAG: hypothetical protein UW79_C0031G0004 [Candidatus Yanofskybacteria bacterium GW2011_GWA2_44_9]OGN04213.1 MAG: hypothetical protein A2659_03985 [Candidatus Yanofskybacteria bacterium RIFCSPHIGHO2_01_FULL_44_24]OGN13915.1 MAG: hypothetical protein A3B99_03455 [Candidatus Yanofskybacteria bacterium RIFCSPHIGHO2_02_FULL_44_12b]OGN25599.1 MAG: hypothetical protein A2925_01735 [Candidatus Yanofskybacteria bacterium RIFCSPLOWO2_01_FULL_44_22]
MTGKLVVRTVLVSVIIVLVWALFWTWTAWFQNTGQRVGLTILEGGVLLAALSLLIESFLSFGNITVKRGTWRDILSGVYIFDEKKDISNINIRTCELFAVRSIMLAMLSMVAAMFLTTLYVAGEGLVAFLLNPHMPTINYTEWGIYIGLGVVGFGLAVLTIGIAKLLEKKITNKYYRVVALALYGSVIFGLLIGTCNLFDPINDLSFFLTVLTGAGAALLLVCFVGAIFGVGYGLYKLVGNMSMRFPVLGKAWNNLCPVWTINFKDR